MTTDRTTSIRRTNGVRRTLLVGAVTASLGVTAACGIAAQNSAGSSTGSGSGTTTLEPRLDEPPPQQLQRYDEPASRARPAPPHTPPRPGPDMVAAREWELWSTRARLVVTDPGALDRALALVGDLLAEVEVAASRFRDDSEVSTLRPGADGTVRGLPDAGRPARRGPRGRGARRTVRWTPPSAPPCRRSATTATSGWSRAAPGWSPWCGRCRAGGPSTSPAVASRLPEGLELDLGATAKAVAADRAAALVAERLGVGVLVSLGGDIATAGAAPQGGWQVRVQDTDADPATQVALPAGTALATSSTVRRTWRRGNETLHHIVDPATGRPAEPVWRSVSVAARSCAVANAAATATIVKGTAGLAWLAGQGLPARLVDRDGVVHLRSGWPEEPEGEAA